ETPIRFNAACYASHACLFKNSDNASRLRADVRELAEPSARSRLIMHQFKARRLAKLSIVAIIVAVSSIACHIPGKSITSNYNNVDQFSFDVAQGPKNYHIEGYLTRS